jgi:NADPH-dependent 2,4-dienoyl-CoA reductase/sulfur reductase-like enzyme
MSDYDIIVIGAGPAGMVAALTAANTGLNVLLLDEQPSPGGQIYRSILNAPDSRKAILGPSYTEGFEWAKLIAKTELTYRPSATVWHLDDLGNITYSADGLTSKVQGRRVILATGALERPVPIPGWTLPGVMTAGAAQILLKSSGIVPERAVLAGSGPLLYLLAAQLIRAGAPPLAIVETQSYSSLMAALSKFRFSRSAFVALDQGLAMLQEINKARIPRYKATSDLAIEGQDRAEALTFTAKRKTVRIECNEILLHQGVIPNTQITRALRLEHHWHKQQACFHPTTDANGQTSNHIYWIAGDGAAIGGVRVAELQGELVARSVAATLGIDADPSRLYVLPILIKKELAIRPFLDRVYQPPKSTLTPLDSITVCRCEEVTAGQIRTYARLGCLGPNQTKAFGRPGMGPCQGRYCGSTVTEILASENGVSQEETGSYRIRTPIKPVTLGEIAGSSDE